MLQVTREWNYSRIIWFKYAKLSCKGLYSLQSILKYSNHTFKVQKVKSMKLHIGISSIFDCFQFDCNSFVGILIWDSLAHQFSGRPIQICDRCEIHHCLKKLNGMLKCINKISTYGWVGYNTRVHNVSLIVMYLNSHDLRIKKFSTNR